MRLFHYTVGVWLADILSGGCIKLATALIDSGERPAAWFTTKPSWEKTCDKLWRSNDGLVFLNEEETEVLYGGLFRIEVDPKAAPYKWRDYRTMSGVTPKTFRGLDTDAREGGARPDVEWRVSFEPVTSEHLLAIERKNGQKWEVIWKRGEPLTRGLPVKNTNLTQGFRLSAEV